MHEKKREHVKDGVRRAKNGQKKEENVKASLQQKKLRRGKKEKDNTCLLQDDT